MLLRRFTTLLALLVGTITLPGQISSCPPLPTHIDVSSGSFSPQPGVEFHLRHFVATLVPRGKDDPLCYQKTTYVSRADIFVDNDSLTRVFASRLGEAKTKIRDFKIENGEARVKLSGHITKIIPIAFTVEGPVTTDGNSIILTADKIKADGIPVKALLALIGDHLSDVLKIDNLKGVAASENTLSFDPEQIAHLHGHLASVVASPAGVTLHYTRPAAPARIRKPLKASAALSAPARAAIAATK